MIKKIENKNNVFKLDTLEGDVSLLNLINNIEKGIRKQKYIKTGAKADYMKKMY